MWILIVNGACYWMKNNSHALSTAHFYEVLNNCCISTSSNLDIIYHILMKAHVHQ